MSLCDGGGADCSRHAHSSHATAVRNGTVVCGHRGVSPKLVAVAGGCVGVWFGRGAHSQTWEEPLRKHRERIAAPPVGALPQW